MRSWWRLAREVKRAVHCSGEIERSYVEWVDKREKRPINERDWRRGGRMPTWL